MKRHAAMLIALSAIATTPALASDEAHAHPQYTLVQPLIDHSRAAEERGRIGRPVFWLDTTGWEGIELGADERRRKLRSSLPVLRSGKTTFPEGMGVAGYRAHGIKKPKYAMAKRVSYPADSLSGA